MSKGNPVDAIVAVIEDSLERHGIYLADMEGTLDDAERALAALAENITPEMVRAFWDGYSNEGGVEEGLRAMCAAAVKGEGV